MAFASSAAPCGVSNVHTQLRRQTLSRPRATRHTSKSLHRPVHCVLQQPPASAPPPLSEKPAPPPRFYTFEPSDVEAVRIRHVLVGTEELADTVFDMVRKKQCTLASLAHTLSLCAATKDNFGDLGWWYADETISPDAVKLGMNAQLFEAALGSEVNKLSRFTSDAGIHVYVVEDVRHRLRTARKPAPAPRRDVPRKEVTVVPMSYAIQTLGCQMNRADSERMAGEMERLGYHEVADPAHAALVVLNTCSIRDHAESKVYSYLGVQSQRKRAAPGEISLVVSGCVAQQESEALLRRVPELDLVIGPQYVNRLGDLLEDVKTNHVQVAATEPVYIHEDISKPRRQSTVTAWVNVIYGCNERCTYCVVPHVRGLEQSRTIDAIVEEVREIAKTSVREICLLGQNIDAFGRDLYPKRTFAELLEAVHEVPGIDRIRFTTSHPRYMSVNVIDTIARLPKLMPSFLIPPQSGDNGVLAAMKRGYTVERFHAIVDNIRDRIPDASISGDIIVGFPGESEEAFQNTLAMMDKVRFDTIHTAAYSPRPNTPAATAPNQLSEAVKTDRLRRINEKVTQHAQERSNRYVGRVEHVLVEGAAKGKGQVMGRNETNRVVVFPGDIQALRGKIVPVKIVQALAYTIVGEMAGEPY